MPTETVYGLAADAFNADAVSRIFEAKNRPSFDPLIVHVAELDDLSGVLANPLSGVAKALAEAFWPGPLTLVAERHPDVPDLVTSGLSTVAVRVPAHPVARALIRAAGTPLAAPSANPFGGVSPTRPEHVTRQLGDRVAMVLDGGPCEHGVESTIVSVVDSAPVVLRFGGLTIEEIEAITGPIQTRRHSSDRPEAPGQLSRHYATRTPLRIVSEDTANPAPDAALLVVAGPAPAWGKGYGWVRALSPNDDLRIAARDLFAAMHALDAASISRIDVVPCERRGLGRAIMDRLDRAAISHT